jgi:hypothetical protein
MGLDPPVYLDDRQEVYRVKEAANSRPVVTTALFLGANFASGGWSGLDPRYPDPARSVIRPDGARIVVWATQPTAARLHLVAWKTGPGKFLRLTVNAEPCLEERVRSEPQALDALIRLRRGANMLLLQGGMTIGPMSLDALGPP